MSGNLRNTVPHNMLHPGDNADDCRLRVHHDRRLLPLQPLIIAADDDAARPQPSLGLLAGRRPLRTAGAYVTEWGDAEWLQQSAAPRTVQHKAPLPRRGTDRGKRPACERQVESQAAKTLRSVT